MWELGLRRTNCEKDGHHMNFEIQVHKEEQCLAEGRSGISQEVEEVKIKFGLEGAIYG